MGHNIHVHLESASRSGGPGHTKHLKAVNSGIFKRVKKRKALNKEVQLLHLGCQERVLGDNNKTGYRLILLSLDTLAFLIESISMWAGAWYS